MPEDDGESTPETPQIDPTVHDSILLENALLRAGVNLDSPQGQLVQQAWQGKEIDQAAIAAQWEMVRPQDTTPEPPAPERVEGEERQGEERRVLASSSTVEPDPTDRDPMVESMRAAHDVLSPPPGSLQRQGTSEDAIATALRLRGDAAVAGDARVLYVDRHTGQ